MSSDRVEQLIALGREHYNANEYERAEPYLAAMAEWQEVLRIDPSNKRAQLYIRMCNDDNGPQPGSALPR